VPQLIKGYFGKETLKGGGYNKDTVGQEKGRDTGATQFDAASIGCHPEVEKLGAC